MTFDERFPKVSEKQFELAAAIAKEVREAKAALKTRERTDPQETPSQVWEVIKLFEYTLYPTEEIVNVWRMQVQAFTGNDLTSAAWSWPHIMPKKLLKRYKQRIKGLPKEFIARPPRILGECGWDVDGGIVNEDIVMYQKHLFLFYYSGLIAHLRSLEHPVILEIGSGYGALGYFIKKLVPNARYYMVDLVESLVFPAVYLQTTMPEYVNAHSVYSGKDQKTLNPQGDAFTFIPAPLAKDMRDHAVVDLAINTGSFGEMEASQVEDYAALVSDVLVPGGFLYEENQDTHISVSGILKKKFTYLPFRYQQKIWAKEKEAFTPLKRNAKAIDNSESRFAFFERHAVDSLSRAMQKFPAAKRFLKSALPF